ncbi:MAG: TonB-dependent receptor, partial [bacterium]|nr:TonB-dependent receptor [bacterium]
ISNVTAQDRQLWAPLGIHNYTSRVQSIYDYDTRVDNFSLFGRMTWKPNSAFTLQGGSQLIYTVSEVIENPIPLLDFGTWQFFDVAKRTTADLKGDRKFGWCNDYLRKYLYLTPWIGVNYNLTADMNLFARLAHAKKEPAILDWYDSSRGPLLQAKYYPDSEEAQSLNSESVNSFEFGTSYQATNFMANVGYYYTLFDNKIESVIDMNDRRTTMNAGRALFQGIECEAKYRFKNVDFSSAITFARNRWEKMNVKEIFGSDASQVVGKVVPFSPERMVTMALNYNFNSRQSNQARLGFRLNYWDEYYGTYTNNYAVYEKIIGADNLPYWVPRYLKAKLPYFLDVSAQFSYTIKAQKVDVTFRIDANNILNRADNFMRAQYAIDYTRNDKLAGKYNWYVLQAPLFNMFFTTEIAIH